MPYHVIFSSETVPLKAPTDLESIFIAANGDLYEPRITNAGLTRTFSWVRTRSLPVGDLVQGSSLTARNAADSGDQLIVRPTTFTNNSTVYDLIEMLEGKLVYDFNYNYVLALLDSMGILLTAASTYGTGDSAYAAKYTQVTKSGIDINDGTGQATLQSQSVNTVYFRLKGLRTDDPHVAGEVWANSGVLTISNG